MSYESTDGTVKHYVHCPKMTNFVNGKCTCYETFESFLQEQFMKTSWADGLTKDRFEEVYEVWVCELGADDLTEYAQKYGDYLVKLLN